MNSENTKIVFKIEHSGTSGGVELNGNLSDRPNVGASFNIMFQHG